jgi:hypothetical protein
MTEADLDRLRAALVDIRGELVERLAAKVDGGDLALLSSVGGALRAVDDMVREQNDDAVLR